MSLLHTESFIAYPRFPNDDAFNTANGNVRKAVAANLRRGGYDVIIPDQSTTVYSAGFMLRNDPVDPSRAALVFSNPSYSGLSAAIRKKTGIRDTPIIGGMSIFVPPEFVKSATVDGTTLVSFHATREAALPASWPTSTYDVFSPTGLFNIGLDLQIRWGTEAPQSSKALGVGRTNYVEFRISGGEVRVWIDDTLVLQKAVVLTPEAIGFSHFSQATNVGLAGRIAYSNLYILAEDAVAPNVRLGPTTRVIGARPTADVDVHFIRASSKPSNASVAGQDIVADPEFSLQSTTVGDQDIYSTDSDTLTAGAALIHAVSVKALASNLEGSPHTLRGIIRSGVNEALSQKPHALELRAPISARNLFGLAVRPSDGRVYACGSGNSIYVTPPNGDGTSWTQLADDGTAGACKGIAIRADGAGIAVRDDGKMMYMAPGADTWAVISPTASAGFALNCITVMADGTFVAAGASGRCVRSSTPGTPASWVSSTVNASYAIAQIAGFGTRLVCTTQSVVASTVWVSNDNGASWTAYGSNMPAGAYWGIAHNGASWFHAGYVAYSAGLSPPLMAKSTDGSTWTTPAQTIGNSGPGGPDSAIAATANRATGETIFVGNGGAVLATHDGTAFKQLSRLTANSLNCVVVTPSGGWIIGGNTGTLLVYRPAPADVPLTPLAGYIPTFNYSNIDPATGTAWTAAAAAASQFGMRLTS